MKTSSDNLGVLITEIKRRWVTRALKQGAAVLFLTFLLCSAFYLLLLYRYELSPVWQYIILGASLALLLAETAVFIVRPLFRKFSDRKIALFIEEKFPELEDRLNSAVEVGAPASVKDKDAIIDMLIADASSKTRMIEISTVIDRRKQQILSWAAYSLFVLAALFAMSYRSQLGTLASRMVFMLDTGEYRPEISIIPGDIQIERGESQEILVTLRKPSPGEVVLHYKSGSDIWRMESMTIGADQLSYAHLFSGIQEPIDYYIEFRESVSPEYSISIYEFPQVIRIDLEYSFPSYTGMPVRREENTGNIRGLVGSEVTLTITATENAETGELVLNNESRIPLSPQGGGVFSGKLVIEDYADYHVLLTDAEEKNNKFPEEYMITPVEDELPLITITDPKRDVRVNPVEEVIIAAEADDDFGLNTVELVYSINGGEEESIDLTGGAPRGQPEVNGSYVMYLEDFSLEPGDIISYYVTAEDNFHTGEPSMTDMYFIEVTPFDASFTQANNQQSGQQSGQQQQQGSQMVMSQQMIIAATWKLHRLRNEKTAEDFNESLDALVQAQANLMYNINDRVNSTAMSQEMVTDDDFLAIADLLRAAVKEMGAALETLLDRDLLEAIKPEQRALNNLLRADALNKEKQVQRQQASQSGSSSGQQSSEERMTELMDLELDISRDKYEIQQQARGQQSEEMDDAMEKLRELAERQQELADQNRTNPPQTEEEQRRFLDRLQRDQEELRQQAEELSRQMREMARNSDQMSRQMQERMEQVAETMRRAEEDLKDDNIGESLARQQQALSELERLRQDLRFSMTDDAREMMREFSENFNRMRDREEQLARDLNETYNETMGNNGRIPDTEELRELTGERRAILENLRTLENQARSIEEQTLQENPDIANDMRNFRNSMRRENLERNMQESERFVQNGWLSYSLPIEERITASLDTLAVQMSGLEGALPVTEEEMLSRSLAETQEMRRRLEDMLAQAENRQSAEGQLSRSGQQNQQQGVQQQAQQSQQGQNTRQNGQARQSGQQDQQSQSQDGRQSQQSQEGQQAQNQQGQQGSSSQQNQQSQGQRPQGQQQAQTTESQQGGRQGEGGQQTPRDMADGRNERQDTALQMERLMDQFDQLLDRMEQDFNQDPDLRQTVETARQRAVSAYTGEELDEETAEHFRRSMYDPLSQLELYLVQRLDEIEMEKKLYSARSADVPAEYKSMVNRYFETISKQNSGIE